MRVQFVELARTGDGVGHRHISVVVEVERSACGDADRVAAQSRHSVAAIAHVDRATRDGGDAGVGVGALHHPFACAGFGEAADVSVVG